MGLDPKSLPDSFLRRISKSDRKASALPPTFQEATAAGEVKLEIQDLHTPFIQWLNLHDDPYVRARPDRKSTMTKSWPDFTVIRGERCCMVEFKIPGRKPDPDQQKLIERLLADGCNVIVTSDLATAIRFVQASLG